MHEKTKAIQDFMISVSDYPTINHSATLEQAVDMMHEMSKKKGYRWIVVLDDNGNLAGFLTLRNVFEAVNNLVPKDSGWMGIYTKIQLIKETPLKKCIRPLVNVFVRKTDHPTKAAEIILNHRITIVPVMDDQMNVVGIVRPVDLLPFIKKLFDSAPN